MSVFWRRTVDCKPYIRLYFGYISWAQVQVVRSIFIYSK